MADVIVEPVWSFLPTRQTVSNLLLFAGMIVTGGLLPFLRKRAVGSDPSVMPFNYLFNALLSRLCICVVSVVYCLWIKRPAKTVHELNQTANGNWVIFACVSILQVISVNAAFFATPFMQGTTSSVIANLRLLICAIMAYFCLKKRQTLGQWIVMIQITVCVWMWTGTTSHGVDVTSVELNVGHIAILINCLSQSALTILTQYALTKLEHLSPWEQTFCASRSGIVAYTVCFLVGTPILKTFQQIDWIGEINGWNISLIFLLTVNTLLSVSVSKRSGVIARTIASSFCLPVTAVLETIFSNVPMHSEKILAIFFLSCGSVLYALTKRERIRSVPPLTTESSVSVPPLTTEFSVTQLSVQPLTTESSAVPDYR